VDTISIDLSPCASTILVCQVLSAVFLDYFAGKLELDQAARSSKASLQVVASGCALIGEKRRNAGHVPSRRFDLAGFAVGAMERGPASGVLSRGVCFWVWHRTGTFLTGYSLVRHIGRTFWSIMGRQRNFSFADAPLGEALPPTRHFTSKQALAAVRAGAMQCVMRAVLTKTCRVSCRVRRAD
jgi:phosphoribosylformylglycinamidine cyclo-ligase